MVSEKLYRNNFKQPGPEDHVIRFIKRILSSLFGDIQKNGKSQNLE